MSSKLAELCAFYEICQFRTFFIKYRPIFEIGIHLFFILVKNWSLSKKTFGSVHSFIVFHRGGSWSAPLHFVALQSSRNERVKKEIKAAADCVYVLFLVV